MISFLLCFFREILLIIITNQVDAVFLQQLWSKLYRHFGRRSCVVMVLDVVQSLVKLSFAIQLNQRAVHHSSATSHCLMDAVLAICYQYVCMRFFVALVSNLWIKIREVVKSYTVDVIISSNRVLVLVSCHKGSSSLSVRRAMVDEESKSLWLFFFRCLTWCFVLGG